MAYARGGTNVTRELTTPHSTWGLGKTLRIRARRAIRRRDPRNTDLRDAMGNNWRGRLDNDGGNPAADQSPNAGGWRRNDPSWRWVPPQDSDLYERRGQDPTERVSLSTEVKGEEEQYWW